jgi:hypothetical protein
MSLGVKMIKHSCKWWIVAYSHKLDDYIIQDYSSDSLYENLLVFGAKFLITFQFVLIYIFVMWNILAENIINLYD